MFALLPLLAPAAFATADGLAYRPGASSTDSVTWEVSHALTLTDLRATTDEGRDVNPPGIEMSAVRTRQVTFSQVHVAAEDGVPVALERRFSEVAETFEGRFAIPDEGHEEVLECDFDAPLEGRTVRFRRDDGGDYERTFVAEDGTENDGEPELLVGLAADAHLGGLLDAVGETRVGATWSAAPEAIAALVCPGGDLGAPLVVPPVDPQAAERVLAGVDPRLGMDLRALLVGDAYGELEGEITCKVVALDAESGRATLALEVEVHATRDVVERIAPWMDEVPPSFEGDVSDALAYLTLDGEGQVVWDLARSVAVGVELELDASYRLEREVQVSTPDGQEVRLRTELELDGKVTSRMTSRDAE